MFSQHWRCRETTLLFPPNNIHLFPLHKREIWRLVHPRKVIFPEGNARGKYDYFEGEHIFISPLCKGNEYFIPPGQRFGEFWSFFQTSLLILWFWYYIVKHLKLSTYFSTRNWRKHLTAAAVLFLVLIESLFNKSSSISLSSAKWNLLAIFVYKIIISEHLWSYLY